METEDILHIRGKNTAELMKKRFRQFKQSLLLVSTMNWRQRPFSAGKKKALIQLGLVCYLPDSRHPVPHQADTDLLPQSIR